MQVFKDLVKNFMLECGIFLVSILIFFFGKFFSIGFPESISIVDYFTDDRISNISSFFAITIL